MVTLIEINAAINRLIREALRETPFATVPLEAEEVMEGINRPSLKVSMEGTNHGNFNASCRECTLTCRVYFFAKDQTKYKFDNAAMQDILSNALLEGLYIKPGFFVPVDSVDCEVTDTVLACSFELYIVELLPEPVKNPAGETIEPMEELNMEGVFM